MQPSPPPRQFTRRQVTASALLAIAATCPLCRSADAYEEPGGNLCAAARMGSPARRELLQTSGDPQLDAALSAEMSTQAQFFGLTPAFLLYTGDSENAAASSRTVISGTEGTIYYHLAFLRRHLSSAQWGGTIVAGIIAHEFAHLHQYSTGRYRTLRKLHRTVKFAELHADYVCGFFMARKQAGQNIDLDNFFEAFHSLGDLRFELETHHGTHAERYFAVKAGYHLALANPEKGIRFAADNGETFVREYIR